MSTSEKNDSDKKSVGRTKRYYVQEKFNHVNIPTQIQLHKQYLDRHHISEIKYTWDCSGLVTLAMFSPDQVYVKNWMELIKAVFGVEAQTRSAAEIACVVSFLERNASTKTIQREVAANRIYRPPRVNPYAASMETPEPFQPVALPEVVSRGSDVAGPAPAMSDFQTIAGSASVADLGVSYFVPTDLVVTDRVQRPVERVPLAQRPSQLSIKEGEVQSLESGLDQGPPSSLKRPAEDQPLMQDSPFVVPDSKGNVDAIRKLVAEFMTQGAASIPPETKYSSSFDQISLPALQKAKERDNKIPFPLDKIRQLLPGICVNSLTQMNPLLRKLAPEHKDSIEVINQSFKSGSSSLLQYYPFPIHVFYEYGAKNSLSSAACLVEFHRRNLELEKKLSSMANYIASVCSSKQLQSIQQIPRGFIDRVMLILKMGSGTAGRGAGFFTPYHSEKQRLAKQLGQFDPASLSAEDKNMYEVARWLAENRAQCMTRISIAFTGHCLSIVPGLLSVVSVAEDLFCLNDPEVAKRVATQLKSVRTEMQEFCKAEINPLIKYGGMLTAYYKDVYSVCLKLNDQVRGIVQISLPLGINLTKINLNLSSKEVEIIDPLNQTFSGGHLRFSAVGDHYLIPFHESYKDRKMLSMEERKAAVDRYHAWRSRVIGDYLAAFFPGAGSLPTLDLMEVGDREVLRWFNEDSHESSLTFSLFPTPSGMKARQVNGRAFGLI